MAPAGASSAIGTVCTLFTFSAWTLRLPKGNFIPCVVQDAGCALFKRVHLMEYLVSTFDMAAAANVEIFAEEFFASIAVHVHIR